MLRLVEIQTHPSSHLVHHAFATSWSENNQIALMTEKGVQILTATATSWNNHLRKCNTLATLLLFATLVLSACVNPAQGNDITGKVFGTATDGMPAAFGNFNSDKFTDLFVLRNNRRTVAILLGSDTEPLLQYNDQLSCTFKDQQITSVVPGDFDGDAQMDVLVTVGVGEVSEVYVLWGETNKLHCNTSGTPLMKMRGQPLAMDYNQDMIVDLFGVDDANGTRMFWVFPKGRDIRPQIHRLVEGDGKLPELKHPHSHAFLDLNGDSYGDLYLTREDNTFEVWLYNKHEQNYYWHQNISLPNTLGKVTYVGQTVFQDLTLEGCLDHLVPVCLESNDCTKSALLVWHQEHERSPPHWTTLRINYKDWSLAYPDKSKMYLDTLTLRPGDFNMDGYPDLLATVKNNGVYKTVLLENVECKSNCGEFPRTFQADFDALNPLSTNTTLGVFYDFLQDGILDVILVHSDGNGKSAVSAFRNSLDYDANFVKVMVSMGQTNNRSSLINNPLGIKQFTYGTNLPGPTVFYSTTTQEGEYRAATSTQLPQSAHYSLMLPYTIFGLGRMPNFVDKLEVHVYGNVRQFFQLIPNSQVVVIPTPRDEPNLWKVQLFVTPSKLIVRSVFALLGTCLLITAIIGVLYWKERREDHREKLQEAHRFHF
ncbi:T-cell immunomodulatory protein isoform X4 [Nilaparvata lugens]|uniref:T-cell immunomodulatory protein isoform X4 n=1 Tax=Nilaparvata lugens TaxID=108931 RepID=UPI00193E4827|nr:T-cell immunomodulatory protein isoform X4 [Nilaparvata lugens]